jgi:hypothetical protein
VTFIALDDMGKSLVSSLERSDRGTGALRARPTSAPSSLRQVLKDGRMEPNSVSGLERSDRN